MRRKTIDMGKDTREEGRGGEGGERGSLAALDWTHPDKPSRSQRDILTNRQLVGGPSEIFQSGSDEGPLGQGRPEKDGLGSGGVVHELLEFAAGRGCRCLRCWGGHLGWYFSSGSSLVLR